MRVLGEELHSKCSPQYRDVSDFIIFEDCPGNLLESQIGEYGVHPALFWGLFPLNSKILASFWLVDKSVLILI